MSTTSSSPLDRTVLDEQEIWWRDHQKWFQKCGFMLRPRYMPDWKPSWLDNGVNNGKYPQFCEDGQPLWRANILNDGTRISDGARVAFKIVLPSVHPHEASIGTFLSSEGLATDPHNHCITIHETLTVPDEDNKVVLVMPLLHRWDEPPMETIGAAIDLFQQLFEGLQFMHKHHVAHRDISRLNVMVDGAMFPDDWHLCNERYNTNYVGETRTFSRLKRPPKYYFIDFGLSRRYDPNDGPPLEPPIFGGDRTVPEFNKPIPLCDPFPTDIYYMGNFIREHIVEKYKGFDFMEPLVSAMVQEEPDMRPTIDEVINCFNVIRKNLGAMKLRSRAGLLDESFGSIRDFAHLFKTLIYLVQRIPAVPTRSAHP